MALQAFLGAFDKRNAPPVGGVETLFRSITSLTKEPPVYSPAFSVRNALPREALEPAYEVVCKSAPETAKFRVTSPSAKTLRGAGVIILSGGGTTALSSSNAEETRRPRTPPVEAPMLSSTPADLPKVDIKSVEDLNANFRKVERVYQSSLPSWWLGGEKGEVENSDSNVPVPSLQTSPGDEPVFLNKDTGRPAIDLRSAVMATGPRGIANLPVATPRSQISLRGIKDMFTQKQLEVLVTTATSRLFDGLSAPEPLGNKKFVMHFGQIMRNAGIDVGMIFKIFDFDVDGVISKADLMYFNFFFTWPGMVKMQKMFLYFEGQLPDAEFSVIMKRMALCTMRSLLKVHSEIHGSNFSRAASSLSDTGPSPTEVMNAVTEVCATLQQIRPIQEFLGKAQANPVLRSWLARMDCVDTPEHQASNSLIGNGVQISWEVKSPSGKEGSDQKKNSLTSQINMVSASSKFDSLVTAAVKEVQVASLKAKAIRENMQRVTESNKSLPTVGGVVKEDNDSPDWKSSQEVVSVQRVHTMLGILLDGSRVSDVGTSS
jgi:hypothetical protein